MNTKELLILAAEHFASKEMVMRDWACDLIATVADEMRHDYGYTGLSEKDEAEFTDWYNDAKKSVRTPVSYGCAICGKDSYGRKYLEDEKKRHRRFYQGDNGPICGYCVKKTGGRCGK